MRLATLETANFSFLALGATTEEAKTAMKKAWATHKRQYKATDTWLDVCEDVHYTTIEPGQALRDGECL